jgi:hypothetical protein
VFRLQLCNYTKLVQPSVEVVVGLASLEEVDALLDLNFAIDQIQGNGISIQAPHARF